MNANLIISVAMGFAWVLVLGLVTASLALAVRLGRDYAFTAPGVSRMGPRIGQRIASGVVPHQGSQLPLGRILAPDHPTMLLFLDSLLGADDLPHTQHVLVSDLLRLATVCKDDLAFVVFYATLSAKMERVLGAQDNVTIVALPDDHLPMKLGVRVTPYAVLVDRHAKVLAKGLVNHGEHVCGVVMRGGRIRSARQELGRLLRICQPFLPEHLRSPARVDAGDSRPVSASSQGDQCNGHEDGRSRRVGATKP